MSKKADQETNVPLHFHAHPSLLEMEMKREVELELVASTVDTHANLKPFT